MHTPSSPRHLGRVTRSGSPFQVGPLFTPAHTIPETSTSDVSVVDFSEVSIVGMPAGGPSLQAASSKLPTQFVQQLPTARRVTSSTVNIGLLTPIPTATVSVFGCAQSVTSRMAPATHTHELEPCVSTMAAAPSIAPIEAQQVHQCDNTSPPAPLQDAAEPSHPSQTRASVGQQQCPSCHRNFPYLSVLHIARCDPPPSPAFLRSVSRWICAACRRLRPSGQ